LLGLGVLQRADRAVEGGPGCAQFGQHVDRARRRLGAQHECADALARLDQPVLDEQLLGLPIVLSPGTW